MPEKSRNFRTTYLRYDGRSKSYKFFSTNPKWVEIMEKHVGPGSELYKELEEEGFNMKTLKFEIKRPYEETIDVCLP